MNDYTSVDFSIDPMGDSVTMVNSDGSTFQVELSVLHVRSESVLTNMPENIANTIAPGSLAFVTGMDDIWQKGFDGEWVGVEF